MENKYTWEVLLFIGHNGQSEHLIRQALCLAEESFGPKSAEAGLCLIDLADCLERLGKFDEAGAVTERYKAILCRFARGNGNLMQAADHEGNNRRTFPLVGGND